MTDKLKELLIDRALLERLRSFCIDSSTYNLATDLLLAEPAVEAAEIEVVDVIGYFNPDNLARVKADEISGFMLHDEESERINTAAMTVAQHRRILEGVNQQAGSGVPESKYNEVLMPFLAMMERELMNNAGKGDRPGWLTMDRKTALLEIYYHLGKLQKATKDGDGVGIVEYAADVANMAMMLVDICELLAPLPPSPAAKAGEE